MRRVLSIHFLTAILLATLLVGPADAEQEVLPPEEVFRYSVEALEDKIVIQWTIEPGHYMYRHRFGFSTETPGIALGTPDIPAGHRHTDEFFGEVETYRDDLTIRIPYERSDAALTTADLEIRSQGCADIGLCYPPQTWAAAVTLPATVTTPTIPDATPAQTESLDLRDVFGKGAEEVPPPEDVFVFTAAMDDPYTVLVRWDIADGYYLYKDQTRFNTASDSVQLGTAELPSGKTKTDEFFGVSEVYYDSVEIRLPIARTGPERGSFELVAESQGCAEELGVCYPPFVQTVDLQLAEVTAESAALATSVGKGPVSEQDRLSSLIRDSHPVAFLASFFGLGLLLAFTPCVLPMIPILSGIIAGEGDRINPGRAFLLSLAYVLGMAATYTAAGAVAAMLGQQLQAFFQQPWIIVTFSLLFVALALSMFGMYELRMPGAIQTRAAEASGKQRRGTYVGSAIMGVLSALIVSACVAPPLVAALTVIGQAGEPLRGGTALFSMSLGMGTPLLIVGASAGTLLPRAGPWMDSIKAAFGVMLLAVAVWMLARIIPGIVSMLLWAALAIVTGVYLITSQPTQSGWRRLWQGLGVLSLAWGLLILVGAAGGGSDPLQPLRGLAASGHVETHELEFERIKTVADLETKLSIAVRDGQTTMLDFYADWCVSCKEMEKYTFTDPTVQALLKSTKLIQADVTANDDEDRALLQYFGIYGPPTIAFFGPDGKERRAYRLIGYKPPEAFSVHAAEALGLPTR